MPLLPLLPKPRRAVEEVGNDAQGLLGMMLEAHPVQVRCVLHHLPSLLAQVGEAAKLHLRSSVGLLLALLMRFHPLRQLLLL